MSLTEELGLSTANIPVRTMEEDLLALLKERHEDKFIELAGERLHEDKDATSKFLQLACERHLVKIVKYLLKPDVDPNLVTEKNSKTPLRIAIQMGFLKVVDLLLDHQNIKVEKDLLSELLMRIDYKTNEERNHERCYKKLLSVGGVDVNCKDKLGNYPLHYGARYGGPEVVLDLLQRKASLSNRNKDDVLTIADCDYDTLRKHFDECVEVGLGQEWNREDMTISFDYRTLLPSPEEAPYEKEASRETAPDDEEKKSCLIQGVTNFLTPVNDAVLYMSNSSELKSLLKHPLITSFLYVKWYRIRWIFYVNLIFYLTFCLSLLLYSATYYGEQGEKSTFPFLLMTLTSLLLLFRELFQLLVLRRKYLTNFENYIELALVATVLFMLVSPSPDDKARKQVCAVVFLLAAFELLFLLGYYPKFSTNIFMFRTVSLNFFLYLLFFSIPILAFAYCFHTLFHVPKSQPSNSTADQTEEKQEFFVNPSISLFKTFVMLTGELATNEIRFDQYPVTSHLLFLAFVITISIILFNLLNGLAISDIQKIRNEAELVGHITRAQYIAHAESMIFYLENLHVPKIFLRCLPTYQTDYTLFVYPNQEGRIRVEKKPFCGNNYMDEKTVRMAMQLVQKKRLEKDRVRQEQEKLMEAIKEKDKVQRERKESERIQKELVQKLDKVWELLRIQGRSRVDQSHKYSGAIERSRHLYRHSSEF